MDRKLISIICILLLSCVFVRQCASQQFRRGQGQVRRQQRCGPCPPTWVGLLDQFRTYLQPAAMRNVCPIAQRTGFMGRCNNPGSPCSTSSRAQVRFCCCPAMQLSKVAECMPGQSHICVPDNFAPWQNELQTAIFSSILG